MPVEQFTVVPDGWVLVPREPTREMIKSGQGAADDKYWLWRGLGERPVGSGLDGMALYVDAAYRAMLSASPKEADVAVCWDCGTSTTHAPGCRENGAEQNPPTQKDPHHGR